MPTVLVVDDEPLILKMMALALEQDGFTVLTAESGAQAIAIARSRPGVIDVLVSDVVMPGMDGPTMASKLRKDDPELQILFMSGFCESAVLDNTRPFPLLAKPFSLGTLLLTVRELVSRSALKPHGLAAPVFVGELATAS